jgi:Xaa-Pro aminopeptidase
MVTSNEPGVYRANQYGIRTENLIVTRKRWESEEFGTFYDFETITLCPIDTRPIARELLTEKEVGWLNDYHEKVYNGLKRFLNEEEKAWLREKTQAI